MSSTWYISQIYQVPSGYTKKNLIDTCSVIVWNNMETFWIRKFQDFSTIFIQYIKQIRDLLCVWHSAIQHKKNMPCKKSIIALSKEYKNKVKNGTFSPKLKESRKKIVAHCVCVSVCVILILNLLNICFSMDVRIDCVMCTKYLACVLQAISMYKCVR